MHTTRAAMEIVSEIFPGSLYNDILWAAYSSDLSYCDYFLWGYLKTQILRYMLQTTDELKGFICHKITAIPEAMAR